MKLLTSYDLDSDEFGPRMTPTEDGDYYAKDEADARIAELEAERDALRRLAMCAYQLAGAHDAPVTWLDALSAASVGEPFSTDGLLPYCGDTLDQIGALMAERDAALADAERYRWIRSQGYSWETEAFISGLSPEQYDAAADKARGAP